MRRGSVLAGLVVLLASAEPGTVRAVAELQPAVQTNPVASSPSRELLDQYCVACHNRRTKAEGRPAFDEIDLGQIGKHAPVLEKVVRKLRSGQMPPDGSRKPPAETLDRFGAAREAALDREAARAPDPGRVASRRLNRLEYVNAVEDLLALKVDGTQLLPSDMAGFGFDNNADVLSITPALMARYNAAATKISRAAVGSLENRPTQHMYALAFERPDARMNEEMAFSTHRGLPLRHLFPRDGEYLFAIRLKGGEGGGGIVGLEDEHQIELRLDHGLVKRFTIGGRFKRPIPGVAIDEDDVEAHQILEYRMNADKVLEIRVPVKAGSKLVAAAFTDSTPTPLEGAYGQPGIDKLLISGPFGGTPPEDTVSRRRIFVCRPSTVREEEPCARQIISALTRQAYRRPIGEPDVEPLLAIYREGRRTRDFDAGIERALEALLAMPEFLLRIEREPADVKAGSGYRVSDLELASRLSFFLWRSLPDDVLLDVAARGQLGDEAVLARQVRRMLAD